jgi:cytochrome c553
VVEPVGVLVVVLVTALLAWLAVRAWRGPRSWWRWAGGAVAGLLALVSLAALALAASGYWKLNRRHSNPVPDIAVAATPEQVERGGRLAVMCAGCHAADGEPPFEGNDFLAEPGAPPVGRFYAPNLTPIHLGAWSDGEIVRAIREGVHRTGRSLVIMPSDVFRNLSDDDVEALVAYLRSQPAVEPDTPSPRLNLLGAAMVNFAPLLVAQAPITEPVHGAEPGRTLEYGRYVASFACTGCHGETLTGNEDFGAPTLVGAALAWTDEDFASFFETGVRPGGGAPVDPSAMPWSELGQMLGEDGVAAVVLHLRERFTPPSG